MKTNEYLEYAKYLIKRLLELEGECKYTYTGYCYEHEQDALCVVHQARVFLKVDHD